MFTSDTKVLVRNNTYKLVKDLEVGDNVIGTTLEPINSYDKFLSKNILTANKITRIQKVNSNFVRFVESDQDNIYKISKCGLNVLMYFLSSTGEWKPFIEIKEYSCEDEFLRIPDIFTEEIIRVNSYRILWSSDTCSVDEYCNGDLYLIETDNHTMNMNGLICLDSTMNNGYKPKYQPLNILQKIGYTINEFIEYWR